LGNLLDVDLNAVTGLEEFVLADEVVWKRGEGEPIGGALGDGGVEGVD
jgi:hypothetical protein